MIYFDNSMASRPTDKATAALIPYLTDHFANPMAPHKMGQDLYKEIAKSCDAIFRLLGAKQEDSFVFTSSGAEAISQALMSAYLGVSIPTGKNHFITSKTEEAPILMGLERLEKLGCVTKFISPDSFGQITKEALQEAITPRTCMISLSVTNGLTGVITHLEEIVSLCQQRGILLHLDATFALSHLNSDLSFADYISFNGNQLHAPLGTGGLWIRQGVAAHPLIPGGMEQDGLRAGTLPVGLLAALGVACEEVLEAREYLCTEIARLRNLFESLVVAGFPDARPLFRDVERAPHLSCIAFPQMTNESLCYLLQKRGVYCSIGGGSFQQVGLVLEGCGIPEELAHTALSFSFSRNTNQNEIEEGAKIVVEEAKKLKVLAGDLV
jgi:cysteine desulfurase